MSAFSVMIMLKVWIVIFIRQDDGGKTFAEVMRLRSMELAQFEAAESWGRRLKLKLIPEKTVRDSSEQLRWGDVI
ncbi:MAG: hypothetical protein ACLR7D_03810 [Lachnospira eligens]